MFSLTIAEVVPLGGELLEMGSDDPARTAPGRPEVDEHGLVGLEHLGLEVGVRYLVDRACHVRAPCRFPNASKSIARVYARGVSARGPSRPPPARSSAVIFDCPSRRSRNTIGTSVTREAGLDRAVGHLDLEAVAVGVDAVEVERLEHRAGGST